MADLLSAVPHRAAQSVFSSWGDDRLFERSGAVHLEGPPIVLDRAAFNAALVKRARTVAEHWDARITSATYDGARWRLMAGRQALGARLVVDATGRAGVIARTRAKRFSADQLVATIGFMAQSQNSEVAPTPATLIEAVPGGWWYAALLPSGRLVINHYTDADLISRPDPGLEAAMQETTCIARWVAEAGFALTAPPFRASASTTWLAPAAGPWWFAVGDAAAAFDPLSSHGMTTALWTGARAGQAAEAALRGDHGPAERYARSVAEGVSDFLETRRALYARQTRYGDRPFWQRRALVEPPLGVTAR